MICLEAYPLPSVLGTLGVAQARLALTHTPDLKLTFSDCLRSSVRAPPALL